MNNRGLELEHDYHPPGEYRFTPDALTLSFCLQRIDVEQVDDTRPWSGTCFRDDIKVMPRGRARTFRHRTDYRFVCITIPDDSIDIDAERLVQLRPQVVLRDVRLRLVLEALLVEAASGAQPRLFRDAVARAMVARLLELDGERPPPMRTPVLAPAVLARVLEYLDAHLGDVSVGDLAAVAGLSSAHFAMAFRSSVGEPPHRYHLRLRIDAHACCSNRAWVPSRQRSRPDSRPEPPGSPHAAAARHHSWRPRALLPLHAETSQPMSGVADKDDSSARRQQAAPKRQPGKARAGADGVVALAGCRVLRPPGLAAPSRSSRQLPSRAASPRT